MGAGGASLLLVEDDPLMRFGSQEILIEAGYLVIVASTGREAEALFLEHCPRIALVVTDIQLGNPPNGWNVAHRAREIDPQIGVVYATGDSAAEWTENGVAGSILLKKPFREAELVAAVAKALAGNWRLGA